MLIRIASDYRIARCLFSLSFMLASFLALAVARPLIAAPNVRIVYVKAGASDSETGASWGHARSLQSALTNAVAGDEIWVAAGIYSPGHTFLSTFTLKNHVALYGGFAGTET